MGVYINGMEMPDKCGSCPCFHAEHPIHCQAVKTDRAKRIAAPYGLPRPDWCPLVEVVRTGEGLYDTYTPPDKETAKHVSEVIRKSSERMGLEE